MKPLSPAARYLLLLIIFQNAGDKTPFPTLGKFQIFKFQKSKLAVEVKVTSISPLKRKNIPLFAYLAAGDQAQPGFAQKAS